MLCSPVEAERLARLLAGRPVRRLYGPPAEMSFYLAYDGQGGLELRRPADPSGLAVGRRDIERRLAGDFMLGRACGLKRGVALSILDATAGLGVDGMALALRGQRLTLVERQPLLWALLVDLKDRLELDDVSVCCLDHKVMLETGEDFDVVYFDPMFPRRRKGALPGKAMQILAALLDGEAAFDGSLINLARQRARQRVVLKRRARDPELGSPDWSIRGRAIRYDVYRGLAD